MALVLTVLITLIILVALYRLAATVIAGLLFLASAFALWTGRADARRVTVGAAALAVIVHGAGLALAQPGVVAILLGVVSATWYREGR